MKNEYNAENGERVCVLLGRNQEFYTRFFTLYTLFTVHTSIFWCSVMMADEESSSNNSISSIIIIDLSSWWVLDEFLLACFIYYSMNQQQCRSTFNNNTQQQTIKYSTVVVAGSITHTHTQQKQQQHQRASELRSRENSQVPFGRFPTYAFFPTDFYVSTSPHRNSGKNKRTKKKNNGIIELNWIEFSGGGRARDKSSGSVLFYWIDILLCWWMNEWMSGWGYDGLWWLMMAHDGSWWLMMMLGSFFPSRSIDRSNKDKGRRKEYY